MAALGFPKKERLSSKKAIAALFESGTGAFVYPFRYIVTQHPAGDGQPPLAVLINVSKRNHKRAVRRNLLKRRTREAWRLSKAPLTDACAGKGIRLEVALLYSSKEAEDYKTIRNAVGKIVEKLGGSL